MSEGCEAMLAGPKPGIDYAAVAADAPKISTTIDYIDHALFEATPMVFATLIDPVPESPMPTSRFRAAPNVEKINEPFLFRDGSSPAEYEVAAVPRDADAAAADHRSPAGASPGRPRSAAVRAVKSRTLGMSSGAA
jgi:hypothetical protein